MILITLHKALAAHVLLRTSRADSSLLLYASILLSAFQPVCRSVFLPIFQNYIRIPCCWYTITMFLGVSTCVIESGKTFFHPWHRVHSMSALKWQKYNIFFKNYFYIRFWYLRCCGCPWNRGRQHLATPLKTCQNIEAGFLTETKYKLVTTFRTLSPNVIESKG